MPSQIGPWLRDWFVRGWKASLFVGALVSLAHDLGWLDTIDTYALLAVGNVASEAERRDSCSDLPHLPSPQRHVIAVEINQRHFDHEYLARSPLDRCQLKDDLKLIYDTNPALLVIDLDLSPALWIMKHPTEPQKSCETALHSLIRQRAPETPTVMMRPFDLDSRDRDLAPYIKEKKEWRGRMSESQVTFGAPDIPVTYGVVVRADARPSSLLRVAYDVGINHGVLPSRTSHEESQKNEDSQENENLIPIDPRKYFRSDGVQPRPLRNPRCCNPQHVLSQLPGQIVFFGAAYGSEEDTFLTPAGEIYGVEVHAASLLSYVHPLTHNKFWDFVIDLIFAGAFSLAMAWMWTRYARARRFSEEDGHELVGVRVLDIPSHVLFQMLIVFAPSRERIRAIREGAGLFALLFGVVSIGLLFAFLGVSVWLLRHYGIWASPVPILVGMLIDSLVSRWHEDSEPHLPLPAGPRSKPWPRALMAWLFGAGLWSTSTISATWVTVRRGVWLVVVCVELYLVCSSLFALIFRS